MKKKFNKKILIIGYGAVSQCTLPILMDKIDVPLENITIIDYGDKSKALKNYTDQGLIYIHEKITRENLNQVLSKYLDSGGLLIDLGVNIGTKDIVKWCHDHNVLYVNSETFGLSDRLTVWEDGMAIYRPTVNYVYVPCHETLSSLCELRGRNYELQPMIRILRDEIISGDDTLGRSLAPGQNATTLQVAAGIVAAVNRKILIKENPAAKYNQDTWQFENFLFKVNNNC